MLPLDPKLILQLVLYSIFLIIFNEFLIFYFVQFKCDYAKLNSTNPDSDKNEGVTAMVLADTHLLGSRYGHWFDKLRREWQMYRSFQTAMTLHNPDLVFVLGDITDEGLFCSPYEFEYYVKRFRNLFHVPERTRIYAVVGNHDIGFHFSITPYLNQRYVESFNLSAVEMVSFKDVHFVLINSMALEGDGCFLCREAEKKLVKLERILKCTKDEAGDKCKNIPKLSNYSRPIVMQHFPLYRPSDMICNETDSAPFPIRNEIFRESRECLSRKSTRKLLRQLDPRLVMSGHTHHGCVVPLANKGGIEITVPSFSWRNKNNPTYSLLKITPSDYSWKRCHMPEESLVISTYILGAFTAVIWLTYSILIRIRRRKYKYA